MMNIDGAPHTSGLSKMIWWGDSGPQTRGGNLTTPLWMMEMMMMITGGEEGIAVTLMSWSGRMFMSTTSHLRKPWSILTPLYM